MCSTISQTPTSSSGGDRSAARTRNVRHQTGRAAGTYLSVSAPGAETIAVAPAQPGGQLQLAHTGDALVAGHASGVVAAAAAVARDALAHRVLISAVGVARTHERPGAEVVRAALGVAPAAVAHSGLTDGRHAKKSLATLSVFAAAAARA